MRKSFSRYMVVLTSVLVIMALVAGCVTENKTVDQKTTPQTVTQAPATKIPSVPPAPKQLYITVGQSEQFTYWGHNIVIDYTSAYPDQIVQVTVDGVETTFQRGLSESPTGIYWKDGNLSFTLKPVLWETRDGQRIPFYEKTWDTTELYFEAMISGVDLTGDDAEKRELFK